MLKRNNVWPLNFAIKSIFQLQRLWNWFRRLTVMKHCCSTYQTTIFEWHKWFREGRESVKNDKRSGRPTTSRTYDNIAAVDKMVKEDRRVTSRLRVDTLGIPKTVVLRILREDLKKRKLCSRFGSNNSTVSDSKTSRNIEPPPILARCVSPRLLPVPEGEVAAEGCKIWHNWRDSESRDRPAKQDFHRRLF